MNIEWGSDSARKFATNVGLVTSKGPYGDNIMAAEWTHHLSYEPGLIAVCLDTNHATSENIRNTKAFGIGICGSDQNIVSSVSGNNSAKEVDKIKILKEIGIEFYKAKKIDVLMVKGSAANFECKLVNEIPLGDHVMFVGEVVEFSFSDKQPLVLSQGKYWKLTENIQKPPQEILDRVKTLVEKYKK